MKWFILVVAIMLCGCTAEFELMGQLFLFAYKDTFGVSVLTRLEEWK